MCLLYDVSIHQSMQRDLGITLLHTLYYSCAVYLFHHDERRLLVLNSSASI